MTTRYGVAALIVGLLAVVAMMCPGLVAAEPATKPLGLDRVIAFTYLGGKYNPKDLHSVTFIEPVKPKAWQDWSQRGVYTAVGHTWFDLMRNPVDKAVDILAKADYGGNPQPMASIDEFGFDYGGQADNKAAAILRQTKLARPDLGLSVWEMRGPIPKVLAETYRDVAALVMLEAYIRDKNQYWWMAAQAQSARIHGLLPKTIIVLGLGKGGNPGEIWACTKEELEQQIRFVRLIAPESPGIGFFSGGNWPELVDTADQLCGHYGDLPTDGTGLPADVVATARIFSQAYAKAMIVACPQWVEPEHNADDATKLVEPKVMRAFLMNLGDRDATHVHIALRNPQDKGGDIFATGVVDVIAAHGEVEATLTVTAEWKSWKTWIMEIDVPDGTTKIFQR